MILEDAMFIVVGDTVAWLGSHEVPSTSFLKCFIIFSELPSGKSMPSSPI